MHAIIIPYPAQGHINPMIHLSLKLLQEDTGFTHVTFINTQFNHDRITANGQSQDLFTMPGLELLTITDGLPADHGRLNDSRIPEFANAIDALHKPLQNLIEDLVFEASSGISKPPITCIIADIFLYWMAEIADTIRLPWAAFWTIPAYASLAYCSISQLVAQGIVPVNGMSSESTQRVVDCIPGVLPIKAYELPSLLHSPDGSPHDFYFQWSLRRFSSGLPQRARWHLANTTYELDGEAAHPFQEFMGGEYWPVGPLLPSEFFSGQMHKTRAMATGLWPESTGCKEWLDKQEDRSVLYISFGSIAHMAAEQVEEVAAGVEASGYPFIWVLRMDVDAAIVAKLEGFRERTRHRGLVVPWAPQLLVLSHRSVGAFLTHCGWNSILEAISGGIPMLAWLGSSAEQNMNAKYITEVWHVALGFKQELTEEGRLLVKKEEIEKVILKVLSACSDGEALRERAEQLQKIVREAILSVEGSSQANLSHFVEALNQHNIQQSSYTGN